MSDKASEQTQNEKQDIKTASEQPAERKKNTKNLNFASTLKSITSPHTVSTDELYTPLAKHHALLELLQSAGSRRDAENKTTNEVKPC